VSRPFPSRFGSAILATVFASVAGCSPSAQPSPPSGCVAAAGDYNGRVAAVSTTTLAVVRGYPPVANDARLAAVDPTTTAYVCYIDGEIPKAPPPGPNDTPWPPFDRAVVVSVGNVLDFVMAGYRDNVPLPSGSGT
jgi:ABC-type Fe3+-hydroxamate transport system substrate-binding protein